jgi:KipI family sensor histidine kinase inhibitor
MGLHRTRGPRLERFGERALLLRAANQSSVRAIADVLLADLRAGTLEDVVPGDRSLLVVFDGTDRGERMARHAVTVAITATVAGDPVVTAPVGRHRVIPVSYGGRDGPDLDATADLAGLSAPDLIELHAGREYTVLFLGFAPGFAYLSDIEAELAVPRLATPRTATPAGSVAVAESYTGIYPANLPGGWRVIGWTPTVLFDPTMDPPTYLLPGDVVRFESVDAADLPADPYRPADWVRW